MAGPNTLKHTHTHNLPSTHPPTHPHPPTHIHTPTPPHTHSSPPRRGKKLTEIEKWEYKQLAQAGVLDVREHPLFDEEVRGWGRGRGAPILVLRIGVGALLTRACLGDVCAVEADGFAAEA